MKVPSFVTLASLVGVAMFLGAAFRHPAITTEPVDAARPALDVPQIQEKPTLDGKLDEPCWKEAVEIRLQHGAKKGATVARICRDADHLYIAVRFKAAGPVPNLKQADESAQVSLRIDSNNDGNSYYLISIFPNGSAWTSYREDSPPWIDWSWRPRLPIKLGGADPEWVHEIALPFAIFNMNKQLTAEIGFNIWRNDFANQETHSWVALPTAGRLRGIPPRTFPFPVAEEKPTLQLSPGSAHPGSTGKVKLELEGFLLGGDPHARGVIWDLAVNEKTGELFVLSVPRVRNCPEIQVFDRQGKYLRTVMPFAPTLPRQKVHDLCSRSAVEGGTKLVLPKHFEIFGAVESSLYGEWWHLPQKLVLAPNGDLILSNIYRGTLWRLRPDGSLPAEGWTSIYNPQRNEPFDTTLSVDFKHYGGLNPGGHWYAHKLENYLPYPELCYPYMAFDQDGALHISRGIEYRSSALLRFFAARWEVPYGGAPRQLVDSTAVCWSMKLGDGVMIDNVRGFGFDGKEEPRPSRPSTLPIPKERAGTPFLAECGLALHGKHLLLSDRKAGRLLVFDSNRRPVAAVTHYQAEGKNVALVGPTALALDTQGSLYVLVEDKGKRIIRLKSWQEPELLASSPPLHADTLQFVVDRQAGPPLVWVANGAGYGTLLQLTAGELSLRGKWGDTGESLSSPGQQGYVPILNIDPETGHLYIEDDADFRFGKRGETYRLDQDGKVLKKWPAVSKEVPRLETLFGKDGKLYWWEKGKISRYARSGDPLPFKATGSETLTADKAVHHVGVYFGMDVDKHGNIYCVNTKSGLDVYDADGNLKKKDVLNLNSAVRGIQVDDAGNIYALSRLSPQLHKDSVLEVSRSPLLHLCKYPPEGGKPLWSVPWTGITGRDQVLVGGCGCLRPRLHQALDDRGYLYAAGTYSIRVIDTRTGQLVGEFGSYGNMDCQGKGSKHPHPELPLGTISALAVWKDRLFAVDLLNRRIVKCRIVYQSER